MAATPHRIVGATPTEFLWNPIKLSAWHNLDEGVCVTAEEAFAKACYTPEIFITDQTVQHWAAQHGVLDGAVIADVLDTFVDQGFKQQGTRYDDGPATGVDWTNDLLLRNAIAQGPVKLGVAANQLENAVKGDPPVSGWLGIGFQPDDYIDHCVGGCGYGTIAWLLGQLGVPVPAGVDGAQPGRAIFTWGCIGVLDVPSFLAIVGECWLRVPTTVIVK